EVVIKGSARVQVEWKPHRDGIHVCSLKGTGLEGSSFNQLFLDDRRQVRARFPNWDYDNPLRTGKGYLKVEDGTERADPNPHIIWKPEGFTTKRWANPQTGILHGFQSHNWGNMQYRIEAVDWERRRIDFAEGGFQLQRKHGLGKGRGSSSPYYVENIFEELDAPGEWFLDVENGLLYLYPPDDVDLADAKVEAVVLKRLIDFRGTPEEPVQHINLRGLHFTQTQTTFMDDYDDIARGDWAIHRGGAVYLTGAEDCRIDDCLFEQVGGNGLFVDGYNRRVNVAGCYFTGTGDSAVCFVGWPEAVRDYQTWSKGVEEITDLEPGPKSPDYPAQCSVRNSIMHDVGVYGKQTSAILVSMSLEIAMSHCTIYNIPRAGVTINDGAWGGHILEHCDIWETVRETGEHGPFNGWGRERFWKGLRKDLVHLDAIKPVIIRGNRIRNFRQSVSAGNWTIDLDDGCSNYEIYSNLSLGSTLKLRDGYFRHAWNNIHVSGVPLGWHCWPRESGDVFERNINVITGAAAGADRPQTNQLRPARMPDHPWGERMGPNLWWNVNTKEFSLAGMDWEQYRARGYGEGSVVADPLFVDPAKGDYRVKPGSPALAIGFENFPMDQFGHEQTRIEPFGGEFEESTEVTLRPDARGGRVRYTLDGRKPSPKSRLYRRPLTLAETVTVRAQTFEDGLPVGFEATAVFTKVDRVEHPTWFQSLMAGRWVGPDEDIRVAK
ncbi:MAG: chitobiase/beta-hexosaminidase C-terminal domain-containing protein, partial [Armatimonadota bacterium]